MMVFYYCPDHDEDHENPLSRSEEVYSYDWFWCDRGLGDGHWLKYDEIDTEKKEMTTWNEPDS